MIIILPVGLLGELNDSMGKRPKKVPTIGKPSTNVNFSLPPLLNKMNPSLTPEPIPENRDTCVYREKFTVSKTNYLRALFSLIIYTWVLKNEFL